jgi:hypothetical protein
VPPFHLVEGQHRPISFVLQIFPGGDARFH